jgi:hypothetical protein
MQAALQLRAHSPQLLHLVVSITGFSIEKRERVPSSVPTGQMVLQYVRPLRHASVPVMMSVAAAMANVAMLFIHRGTE